MVHVYHGILLRHKKEQHNVMCSDMDGLETVILSEVRIEKDKYPVILLICGILKNYTNEPIYKTGIVTDTEKKHGYQERKGWGGIKPLLYIKEITNENLLYSTGNSSQYSVMTYTGKEPNKECLCICITISVCV